MFEYVFLFVMIILTIILTLPAQNPIRMFVVACPFVIQKAVKEKDLGLIKKTLKTKIGCKDKCCVVSFSQPE